MQRSVDEAGAQEVVDAEWPAGGGAGGIAPDAGEEAPDLGIVQDAAVAVVGHVNFVGRWVVARGPVVARDPGGQPGSGIGPDGEHCPVEGLQRLIDPVQVLSPIGRQEGVGHPELEDGELGARLQVEGLPDVKLKRAIITCCAFATVDIDRRRHPFLTAEEAPARRLVGGRAVADLPGPLGAGPPRVHDPLRAGAALHVMALTVAERAAPQQLAHHLAQDRPHFRSRSVLPSVCRTFRPGASGSG